MLLRVTPVQVDLVPPHVVVAWRHYFSTKYPSLRVVCFTFHSDQESSMQPQQNVHLRFRRTRGKGLSAVGPKELLWEVVRIHLRQGCVCVCVCGVYVLCMCVVCVYLYCVCSWCIYLSIGNQCTFPVQRNLSEWRRGWHVGPRRREVLLC